MEESEKKFICPLCGDETIDIDVAVISANGDEIPSHYCGACDKHIIDPPQ